MSRKRKDYSYNDESGINEFLNPQPKRKRVDFKGSLIYEVLTPLPPWNHKKYPLFGKDLFNSLIVLKNEGDIPRTQKMHEAVDKTLKAFNPLIKIFRR